MISRDRLNKMHEEDMSCPECRGQLDEGHSEPISDQGDTQIYHQCTNCGLKVYSTI